MRKGTDLIGKPVIGYNCGTQLTTVKDLIFSQEQDVLVALLTAESGVFRNGTVVPLAHILAIGADGIIVQSTSSVVPINQVPEVEKLVKHNNILRGTQIMTVNGRNLGKMVDLYFDDRTGTVEGYEVSGGLFADAYTGRSFVPVSKTFRIGQDFAFVPESVVELMEEQVGGIKAAMIATGEKAQELAQQAGDKAQEIGTAASEKFSEVQSQTSEKVESFKQAASTQLEQAGTQTQAAVASYTVEETLGRRVRSMVYHRNGEVIAAIGQIVTPQTIEKARQYGQEKALINATGLSVSDAAKSQSNAAAHEAGIKARELGDQVQYYASNTLEWAKQKADDLFDRSNNAIEEQRIKGALGRPVNRVILDQQDNVLLNMGELVTHRSISTARQAGVLDILLSSIHDQAPDISYYEMRAPQNGRAALSGSR